MQKFVFPRIILPIALGLTGLVLMEARAAAVVTAMPITLAWKAANDPTVSGYAIYYGPTNQPATNRVDAGTGTSVTLFGLKANVGYRFFAVSYSAAGLQSVPSNELLLAPPAISRLQLARKADGSMQLNAKAAPGTTCSILFTSKLQPQSLLSSGPGRATVVRAVANSAAARRQYALVHEGTSGDKLPAALWVHAQSLTVADPQERHRRRRWQRSRLGYHGPFVIPPILPHGHAMMDAREHAGATPDVAPAWRSCLDSVRVNCCCPHVVIDL